jgi:hypothetical protein
MTPTQHKAGSLAKIDLMRLRAANGDPIFVDGDCTDRVSEAEENATKAEVHRRIIEDVDGLRGLKEKQQCVPKAKRVSRVKLRPTKRMKPKI